MLKRVQKQKRNGSKGFTIVELLIVIVVIAILAAFTTAVFGSMQQRATKSALDSALSGTAKRLQLDKVTRGSFATALSDIQNSTDSNQGGIDYQYTSDGSTYCITATLRNIARYVCSADNTIADGAWSGHDAPVTGPITDPVVHTQTDSFSVTQPAGVSGVDVPISIGYTLQPTDYVFILFNARNNTNITLKNGATPISNLYTRSMGNSGYQSHFAFGLSGLTGQPTLTANACWVTSCPYNGSNVSGINAAYVVYVIRGVGASPTVSSSYTPYGVQPGNNVAVSPTSQSISAKDVAIYSYVFYGNSLPSEADLSTPARTWTIDSTAPPNHLGTAIAARHTFGTGATTIQYQSTMPASGTAYFGSVLFTIK